MPSTRTSSWPLCPSSGGSAAACRPGGRCRTSRSLNVSHVVNGLLWPGRLRPGHLWSELFYLAVCEYPFETRMFVTQTFVTIRRGDVCDQQLKIRENKNCYKWFHKWQGHDNPGHKHQVTPTWQMTSLKACSTVHNFIMKQLKLIAMILFFINFWRLPCWLSYKEVYYK